MSPIVFIIILILFVGLIIYTHIQVVPKTKMYVIERLGKFHKTYESGIVFLIPFIDKVKIKLNSQTNYLSVEPIEIETNDNAKKTISFNDIGYSINDIQKLIYDHPNYNTELLSIIYNVSTNTLKNYSSVELKTYKKDIEKIMKDTLNIKVKTFGITITTVNFKSI